MKTSKSLKTFCCDHATKIAAVILLIAVVMRVVLFGALPGGLNQDEASAAYEAWAIGHYGIDRNGDFLPAYLTSWGSGQNALYTYLTVPFVLMFGLNVYTARIVALIFGCLSLFLFWRICDKLMGRPAGLAGLIYLAFAPYNFMISRWALESNLLPAMLLIAFYFIICRDNIIIGAAALALSMYAYATVIIVMPVLVIGLCWLYRRRWRELLIAAGAFAAVAMPLGLYFLHPKLTVFRSALGGDISKNLYNTFNLLIKQNDGWIYNALPDYGIGYYCLVALALIGVFAARKTPIALWLFAGLVLGALIDVNVNRLNIIWMPIFFFAVAGVRFLYRHLRPLAVVVAVYIAVSAGFFYHTYFGGEYRGNVGGMFYEGAGAAVTRAVEIADGRVIRFAHMGVPNYIYALFYAQIPPKTFADTVVWINPDGEFRWASECEGWRFGGDPKPGEVYIDENFSVIG